MKKNVKAATDWLLSVPNLSTNLVKTAWEKRHLGKGTWVVQEQINSRLAKAEFLPESAFSVMETLNEYDPNVSFYVTIMRLPGRPGSGSLLRLRYPSTVTQ